MHFAKKIKRTISREIRISSKKTKQNQRINLICYENLMNNLLDLNNFLSFFVLSLDNMQFLTNFYKIT